jgi:hypothetical protein
MDIADREDLAETTLFAFALFRHPGRIPPVDAEDIAKAIPHRLAFLNQIFSAAEKRSDRSKTKDTCVRNGGNSELKRCAMI